MNQILGFMCFKVLAEADNFFKMIGPLLIFGIYIIGALAKGWTKSRQHEPNEELSSELKKAVKSRYQEIHDRQVGNNPDRTQPQMPRLAEPVRAVHSAGQVNKPLPVRQTPMRTYPAHQIQAEKPRIPVQHRNRPRNVQQKPVSVKTRAPKPVQKPQAARSHKAKTAQQSRTDQSLASMIRQPQNLRTAIILKEILDKPISMR
jgi:hypothetical protein